MTVGGCSVATGLAAHGVQAEIVTVAAPEQDMGVTLELGLGEHDESELGQCRFVHAAAHQQVTDADADVVDDLAHRWITRLKSVLERAACQ